MKQLAIYALSILVSFNCFAGAGHIDRSTTGKPKSIHPHHFGGGPGAAIMYDLYEGLLRQDETGAAVDGCAVREKLSDTKWKFTLRKGLAWSNNEPLTADDFVDSFRLLATPDTKASYSFYLKVAGIKHATEVLNGDMSPDQLGVYKEDDRTIVIELVSPVPETVFPFLLTFPAFLPVHKSLRVPPSELSEDVYDVKDSLISNGPFTLEGTALSSKIGKYPVFHLRKNTTYYAVNSVRLDSVCWHNIHDKHEELKLFQAGKLDITAGIPSVEYASLSKEECFVSSPTHLSATLFMLPNKGKLEELCKCDLLSLISESINRQEIIQALYPGSTSVRAAERFIDPAMVNIGTFKTPDKTSRPDMAKQWVETTKRQKLVLMSPELTDDRGLLDNIIKQLNTKLSPLSVVLIQYEWGDFLEKVNNDDTGFDFAFYGWVAAYNDPSAFVIPFMPDTRAIPCVALPGLESLYNNRIRGTADPILLQQAYLEAETIILNDAHLIPLLHMPRFSMVSDSVRQSYTRADHNRLGWILSRSLSTTPAMH